MIAIFLFSLNLLICVKTFDIYTYNDSSAQVDIFKNSTILESWKYDQSLGTTCHPSQTIIENSRSHTRKFIISEVALNGQQNLKFQIKVKII